jgi:predicted MFS family arabinose efflux permease
LFTAALFLLVFGLTHANAKGWGSPLIVALLGSAAALMLIFLLIQRAQRHAVLDFSLFRRSAFAGASLSAFALSASMFAMVLYLTVYMQMVMGLSPFQAGVRFPPYTATMCLVSVTSGKLAGRLPARAVIGAGLGLIGPGCC